MGRSTQQGRGTALAPALTSLSVQQCSDHPPHPPPAFTRFSISSAKLHMATGRLAADQQCTHMRCLGSLYLPLPHHWTHMLPLSTGITLLPPPLLCFKTRWSEMSVQSWVDIRAGHPGRGTQMPPQNDCLITLGTGRSGGLRAHICCSVSHNAPVYGDVLDQLVSSAVI